MSDRDVLAAVLGTGGADTVCEAAFEVFAQYVEVELAGGDVAAAFPQEALHLRNCPACAEDHAGLVALLAGA
jgi:hypothetical protein